MPDNWRNSKAPCITILIGYNDLHFDGKTPEEYRARYSELLNVIRENHPQTEIYCITPLFTKKPISDKNGIAIQEFRDVLTALVQQRSTADKHLHLIDGAAISSEANLRQDRRSDPVHLGGKGAAMLAEELALIINK